MDRVDARAVQRQLAGPFRAVQQDIGAHCVDWQVFSVSQDGDLGFSGAVTVLDGSGGQRDVTDWIAPTDDSADEALTGIGWQRVGLWSQDWLGRRGAAVEPVAIPAARSPE